MPEYRVDNSSSQPVIGGDSIAARVVIVGRTGLDAKLRLDPELELIRVRSGFDAIGELANPVGEVPGRTVVIVGAGADIDERNGGEGAFVSAVRRVAPSAMVVRSADLGSNPGTSDAYDGVVLPSASSDELRELIHGRSPTPPAAEPPAEPLHVAAEAPPPPPPTHTEVQLVGADTDKQGSADDLGSSHESAEMSEEGLASAEPTGLRDPVLGHDPVARDSQAEMKPVESLRPGGDGDDVLVAAAMGGRDILEPALGLIRARIGRADVEFVPGDVIDAQQASAGVEVAWSGQRFGVLRITGIDAALIATGADDAAGRLAQHARWLGSWLALAEQQRRLRLEAYTDPVSGAWNRRYFDRFLEAALPHARQHRYKLTVLVFDVDNFKSFNDRFGHEAGDMILSETVRLLRSMTRPSDRICRIGGDEFAVIFYEPEGPRDKHSDHPDDFEAVAARFQRAVEDQRFPKLGIEAPGELTISGGLATYPWDGQSAEELLRRADELSIASKRAGKNQITFGHTGDPGE